MSKKAKCASAGLGTTGRLLDPQMGGGRIRQAVLIEPQLNLHCDILKTRELQEKAPRRRHTPDKNLGDLNRFVLRLIYVKCGASYE